MFQLSLSLWLTHRVYTNSRDVNVSRDGSVPGIAPAAYVVEVQSLGITSGSALNPSVAQSEFAEFALNNTRFRCHRWRGAISHFAQLITNRLDRPMRDVSPKHISIYANISRVAAYLNAHNRRHCAKQNTVSGKKVLESKPNKIATQARSATIEFNFGRG